MLSQIAAENEPQTKRLETWVQVLVLPLAAVLGKLLPLSGSPFSHLQIERVRFDDLIIL